MRRRVLIEKGWAIVGPSGLYTGWWLSRKDAIKAHVRDKLLGSNYDPERVHDAWALCKKDGDRAVRVSLRYET